MKPTLKLLAPALAVIALVSACLPSASSGRSSSHTTTLKPSMLDPRFAEFRYTFTEKPEIQERVDILNEQWLNLDATEAHLTLAFSRTGFFELNIEPEYWMSGVATISDETATMLLNKTNDNRTLLPGIYPGLYEYVPKDCTFSNIDLDHADKTLQRPQFSHATVPTIDPMIIQDLAVSQDCHLMVITALGHRGS